MLLEELGTWTKSLKRSHLERLEQFAPVQVHIYMPATNDNEMHLMHRIAFGKSVNGSPRALAVWAFEQRGASTPKTVVVEDLHYLHSLLIRYMPVLPCCVTKLHLSNGRRYRAKSGLTLQFHLIISQS